MFSAAALWLVLEIPNRTGRRDAILLCCRVSEGLKWRRSRKNIEYRARVLPLALCAPERVSNLAVPLRIVDPQVRDWMDAGCGLCDVRFGIAIAYSYRCRGEDLSPGSSGVPERAVGAEPGGPIAPHGA